MIENNMKHQRQHHSSHKSGKQTTQTYSKQSNNWNREKQPKKRGKIHNLRVQEKSKNKKTSLAAFHEGFPRLEQPEKSDNEKHPSFRSIHPSCMHQSVHRSRGKFRILLLRCVREVPSWPDHGLLWPDLIRTFATSGSSRPFRSFLSPIIRDQLQWTDHLTSPPASQPTSTSHSSRPRFQSPLRLQSGSTRHPPRPYTRFRAQHRPPRPRHYP